MLSIELTLGTHFLSQASSDNHWVLGLPGRDSDFQFNT